MIQGHVPVEASPNRARAVLSVVSDFNFMDIGSVGVTRSQGVSSTGITTSSPDVMHKSTKTRAAKKATYKHVPHSEKPVHLVEKRNERERKRVQAVNSAFLKLRKHVPHEPRNKRLSKFKTLQVAIEYIQHMQDLIQAHDTQTAGKQKQAPRLQDPTHLETKHSRSFSYGAKNAADLSAAYPSSTAMPVDTHFTHARASGRTDRLSSVTCFEGNRFAPIPSTHYVVSDRYYPMSDESRLGGNDHAHPPGHAHPEVDSSNPPSCAYRSYSPLFDMSPVTNSFSNVTSRHSTAMSSDGGRPPYENPSPSQRGITTCHNGGASTEGWNHSLQDHRQTPMAAILPPFPDLHDLPNTPESMTSSLDSWHNGVHTNAFMTSCPSSSFQENTPGTFIPCGGGGESITPSSYTPTPTNTLSYIPTPTTTSSGSLNFVWTDGPAVHDDQLG